MFTAAEAMVVGPVSGLASVTLSVGRDDPEPPFGVARGFSADQLGRAYRSVGARALVAGPTGHRDCQGAGRERAGRPGSGVLDAGPLAEGQRLNSEVHGRDLTGGAAAEHDLGGARPEPGELDAEGGRVVAVGIQAQSPADRGDRDLPADDQVVAADGDLRGAEHPGLGVGQQARPEGVPAAQVAPGRGLLGDVGAHGVVGEIEQAAQDRVGDRARRGQRAERPVLANAMTPVPWPGASSRVEWKPVKIPS